MRASKAGAKVQLFSNTAKYFCKNHPMCSVYTLSHKSLQTYFFLIPQPSASRKTAGAKAVSTQIHLPCQHPSKAPLKPTYIADNQHTEQKHSSYTANTQRINSSWSGDGPRVVRGWSGDSPTAIGGRAVMPRAGSAPPPPSPEWPTIFFCHVGKSAYFCTVVFHSAGVPIESDGTQRAGTAGHIRKTL